MSSAPEHTLDADIVVIGGGSAGTAAAVAAGRMGCSAILVEGGNCLGGTSTAGGVTGWFASIDGLGDVFDDLRSILDRYGARFGNKFNTEYLKLAWQILADEANVRVLFHTTPVAAEVLGDRVVSARLTSGSRPVKVSGSYFIDASGEGSFSALAGAEFAQGDPEHGRTLHMSLTAMLYDTGSPHTPYLPPGYEPIESDGDLPGLHAHEPFPDGRVYLNMTKIMGHDPTDPVSLSEAEAEARRQLVRILHYLQRTKYPNHALSSTGARIGIREGRRIVGDYVLTGSEILGSEHGLTFDDGIAVATSQIDFHSLTRPGHEGWRQRVKPYQIPFRCLCAKGFSNLLVAGKCISGDQVAQSSYRMTPTCVGMGQAAGTAAALAVSSGAVNIREVPIADIQSQLRSDGVELDPTKHAAFPPHGRGETPDPDGAR